GGRGRVGLGLVEAARDLGAALRDLADLRGGGQPAGGAGAPVSPAGRGGEGDGDADPQGILRRHTPHARTPRAAAKRGRRGGRTQRSWRHWAISTPPLPAASRTSTETTCGIWAGMSGTVPLPMASGVTITTCEGAPEKVTVTVQGPGSTRPLSLDASRRAR